VQFPAIKGDDGRADPAVQLRPITHAAAVIVPAADLPAVSVSVGHDEPQAQRPGAVGAPAKEQSMRLAAAEPLAQVSAVGHGPIVHSTDVFQNPAATESPQNGPVRVEAGRPGASQSVPQVAPAHITRDHTYVDVDVDPTLPQFLQGNIPAPQGTATPPYVPVAAQPQPAHRNGSVLFSVQDTEPTYEGGTLPEVVVTPQYVATYAEVQASLNAVQYGLAFTQSLTFYLSNPAPTPYGTSFFSSVPGYVSGMGARMQDIKEILSSYDLNSEDRQLYLLEVANLIAQGSNLSVSVHGARISDYENMKTGATVKSLNELEIEYERRIISQRIVADRLGRELFAASDFVNYKSFESASSKSAML
jgi:hypothetical protein